MSGHTPGNWFVDYTYQWPSKVRSDAYPDKWICDAAGPGGGHLEPLANARLLAAAPDLLEALQRSVHELTVAQSVLEQSGEPALAGMMAVAVQINTEAIAKATPNTAGDDHG